jgi:hypothetical protein
MSNPASNIVSVMTSRSVVGINGSINADANVSTVSSG